MAVDATTKQAVLTGTAGASKEEKAALAQEMGLSQPGGDTGRVVIWVFVLLILAGMFALTVMLAYSRSVDEKSLEPFSTLAALIVGGIVGLLGPSPTAK